MTEAVAPKAPPVIFVDGDACPVREEVYRVASRTGLTVRVVANGSRPIRPPGLPNVSIVIVSDGMDAADDWIAAQIGANDICVTGDIPLASRCLARGAFVLGHTGKPFTQENIGAALAGRDLSRHLRELGLSQGGGKPMTKADRSQFLSMLDTVVFKAKRVAAR